MSKTFIKFFTVATIMLLGQSAFLNAQVTIGANKNPETFSALELISGNNKGLRLPQMTTEQRDAMARTTTFIAKAQNEAMGLQIFNTSTYCVETWNGSAWIASCMDCDGVSFPALSSYYNFCSTSNATISDLTTKVGGNVQWYSAENGGTALANSTLLTATTYYAEQRVANCVKEGERTAVRVYLVNCSSIKSNNARITTFTNVMYDFQHQTVEAYVTEASNGKPTKYEWFVKKTGAGNTTFVPIAGAPDAAFFTIPADFMYQYGGLEKSNTTQTPNGSNSAVELTIRCKMSNPNTTTQIYVSIDILFIRTNTAGYGIENGVSYLTLNRAKHKGTGANTIKYALLNLGASGTGSYINGVEQNKENGKLNDAGDLGDLYQWGRIADGHEHIVWTKNALRENAFGSGTSSSVSRNKDLQEYTSTGQINENTDFYGKFISDASGDWGTEASGNSDLWGNNSNIRSLGAPAALSAWSERGKPNNPCPNGWYVPSRYDLSDIHNNNGNEDAGTSSTVSPFNGNNTWEVRNTQDNTNAAGGIIITNSNGEKLFLPNMGHRSLESGASFSNSAFHYYWSSTYNGTGTAYIMYIYNSNIMAGKGGSSRAFGFSVRCVKE